MRLSAMKPILLMFCLNASLSLFSQGIRTELVTVGDFPIEGGKAIFTPGIRSNAGVVISPGFQSSWEVSTSIGYSFLPLRSPDSVSFTEANILGTFMIPIDRRIELRMRGGGGVFGGMTNSTAFSWFEKGAILESGWGGFIQGGIGSQIYLTPHLMAGLEAGIRWAPGFLLSAQAGINLSFDGSASNSRFYREKINTSPIFPVFLNYYNSHPGISLILRNEERFPMERIKIRISGQATNANVEWMEVKAIVPGSSVSIDVPIFWNNSLLANHEQKTDFVSLDIQYRLGTEDRLSTTTVAVKIFGRNNLVWSPSDASYRGNTLLSIIEEPDGKAAAFINGKDPALIKMVQDILKIQEDTCGYDELGPTFRAVIAILACLQEREIRYRADPNLPAFADVQKRMEVDFLRYPVESLSSGTGDCDDLTILVASLLEAAGVETALITVPGHIFMAANLGIQNSAGKNLFLENSFMITDENADWLPIETTLLDRPIMDMINTGFDKWKHTPVSNRSIFPVHKAWDKFSPVQFPDIPDKSVMRVPFFENTFRAFRSAFAAQQLQSSTGILRQDMGNASKNASALNRLAILNIKYGELEKAIDIFLEALVLEKSYKLYMNLGNAHLLLSQQLAAKRYFSLALIMKDTPEAKQGIALAKGEIPEGKIPDGEDDGSGKTGHSTKASEPARTLQWQE